MELRTSDFDFTLPTELIAQTPIEPRDASRLLVVNRATGTIKHRHFTDLPQYLRAGDVMVFNDSRVIPARLAGKKQGTGGKVEVLLLQKLEPDLWEALVKPGRRVKNGTHLEFDRGVTAEVVSEGEAGIRAIRFSGETSLPVLGAVALPPYIHVPLVETERYQTVYADESGSVAAPTAGLHFTRGLLHEIEQIGVRCLFVTLHIGLDTFRPVQEEDPNHHRIHREFGIVTAETARELSLAKQQGRRIICIGTTSVRLLEDAARRGESKIIPPFKGWVDLYILPGYRFQVVDALVTNFHLPRSTLLMLVSAFSGKALTEKAYTEAIERKYRFYSFGDAMLIL